MDSVSVIDDPTRLSLDDRLAPRRITSVNIALTNDCNLRCTYCPIGTGKFDKSYVSADMLEKLITFIDNHRITTVGLGYSGEVTKAEGWHLFVERLVAKGISISVLSNFSKLFSSEEIDAFAKMDAINISIDTADAPLQKRIRRGMDVKTVVYNIGAIAARAENLGRPVPRIAWICTMTDQVVETFESYVALAISLGIDQVVVHQFLQFRDLPPDCKDVLKLSGDALRRAHGCIVAGIELGKQHNLDVACHWLPLLAAKMVADEPSAKSRTVSCPSILGDVEDLAVTDKDLSDHETVGCVMPWQTLYVGGEGNLYPCQVSPYPLGNIADASTIDELLFGEKFQAWRQGALGSQPQLPCRVCPVAGRCTIVDKQAAIDAMPRFGT